MSCKHYNLTPVNVKGYLTVIAHFISQYRKKNNIITYFYAEMIDMCECVCVRLYNWYI